MTWQAFDDWLGGTSIGWIGALLFGALCLAAAAGVALHVVIREHGVAGASPQEDDSGQGYIVSAVLGLLALLMGFTFSLSIDRFDARRMLVLEEANAIGTSYLRAQLLPPPHRERMTGLLILYADTRIALAKAPSSSAEQQRLLKVNDAVLADIWAATSASFDDIKGLDFSSAYLDSINSLIDLDASRKAARAARVPAQVFGVLFIYLITTAGVLGYVLKGARERLAALHLFALLTLSLVLIVDINRPVAGGVVESQRPMENLRASLSARPPEMFDKWRTVRSGPAS